MSSTTRSIHDRSARRTLSLQPLLDHLRTDNVSTFALQVGVSRRSIYNWLEKGIDGWTADRLCVTLAGRHPIEVYGPVWEECFDEDFVPGDLSASITQPTGHEDHSVTLAVA